jgi:hypothetical protein
VEDGTEGVGVETSVRSRRVEGAGAKGGQRGGRREEGPTWRGSVRRLT